MQTGDQTDDEECVEKRVGWIQWQEVDRCLDCGMGGFGGATCTITSTSQVGLVLKEAK